MLAPIPLLLFAAVVLATLLRGRSVKERSGVSAWAFAEARGMQRVAVLTFAAAIGILAVAAILLASSRLTADPASLTIGSAIMAAGALIIIVAQGQMGIAWRVGVRGGDAPLFVSTGLFRFSRNPIFAGMIAMALGAALAVSTWWAWVAAIAFALACRAQVEIEEAHLTAQFGEAYDAFRRTTPRWLLF